MTKFKKGEDAYYRTPAGVVFKVTVAQRHRDGTVSFRLTWEVDRAGKNVGLYWGSTFRLYDHVLATSALG